MRRSQGGTEPCGRSFIATVLLALMAPRAAAAQQETATVIGTVIDAQRAALPGVIVTVRNVETGFNRTGVTDTEGRYRVAAVPPGSYEISAQMQGFGTGVRRGLTLTVGAEAVINFELAVGKRGRGSDGHRGHADRRDDHVGSSGHAPSRADRSAPVVRPRLHGVFCALCRAPPRTTIRMDLADPADGRTPGTSTASTTRDEISGLRAPEPGARLDPGNPGARQRLQGRIRPGLRRRRQRHHPLRDQQFARQRPVPVSG